MTIAAMSGPFVLVQLGLLLGVLVGALVWLGRRARAGEPGIVRPIRLGAHHALHVVTIDDRRLLVGTGPGAAPQLLCDLAERPRGSRTEPAHGTGERATTNGNGVNGFGDRSGLAGFGVAARPRAGWDHGG